MRLQKPRRVLELRAVDEGAVPASAPVTSRLFVFPVATRRWVSTDNTTDGFNPYGMMAASYSCWPLFVIPLNLPPPGVLFQRHTIFVSLIIPEHPGNKMSVYMEPLIDELIKAWEEGGVDVRPSDKDKLQNVCVVPLLSASHSVWYFLRVVYSWKVPMPNMQGNSAVHLVEKRGQVFVV